MARAFTRIYGPALVATGPTTIVTVPASTQYVVTNIWVSNPSASAVSLTLSVGADAAGTRIIGTNTAAQIPANTAGVSQQLIYQGALPVNAAEIITASAGTNNVLVITISGYSNTVG
jgi:hypothetical protein